MQVDKNEEDYGADHNAPDLNRQCRAKWSLPGAFAPVDQDHFDQGPDTEPAEQYQRPGVAICKQVTA